MPPLPMKGPKGLILKPEWASPTSRMASASGDARICDYPIATTGMGDPAGRPYKHGRFTNISHMSFRVQRGIFTNSYLGNRIVEIGINHC